MHCCLPLAHFTGRVIHSTNKSWFQPTPSPPKESLGSDITNRSGFFSRHCSCKEDFLSEGLF